MKLRGTTRAAAVPRGPPLVPFHSIVGPSCPRLHESHAIMSPFFGWFSRRTGATPTSGESAPDLLEQARALAREGKLREACDTYWKIKRKHRTVPGLIEHAELLFDHGDYFGAASMSHDALELEPDNARAEALQVRIRKTEDAERGR